MVGQAGRDVPGRQERRRADRHAPGRGQKTRQHHPVPERGAGRKERPYRRVRAGDPHPSPAAAAGRTEETVRIQVGAILVASGFAEYEPKPGEYAFGAAGGGDPLRIRAPAAGESGERLVHDGREVKKIAFIYCVGSRQGAEMENANRWCSRYCCSTATHLAVQAKKKFPAQPQLPFLPRHAHLRQVRVALRGGGKIGIGLPALPRGASAAARAARAIPGWSRCRTC